MSSATIRSQDEGHLVSEERLALYRRAEDWASWFAVWMIHWANNKPENKDRKPKVGGHQASSVSSSSILTALYLHIKKPTDRIAVKPHAAPFLYSLMYMMGKVSRWQMENLREFGGLPPYPCQHDNPNLVDYSTSIEGLGPCAVIEDAYEALVQKDQLGRQIDSKYHAVVGDGELTELQIGGSLYEAGRRRLGNVRWWIDLNRQSLDRVIEDSPHGSSGEWARRLFDANGWNVIDLKWGSKLERAFSMPGGDLLRKRLEQLGDLHHQALLLVDGLTVRQALLGREGHEDQELAQFLSDFAASAPMERLESHRLEGSLSRYSDADLLSLVKDLGGHDLAKLIQAAKQSDEHNDRPTAIICHTIKGWRMPGWAAHPENHGALMTVEQLEKYRTLLQIPAGEPLDLPQERFLNEVLLERANELFIDSAVTPVEFTRSLLPERGEVRIPLAGERSSSATFGTINTAYLRLPIGKFMAFIAPDVGLTTHLGGVISLSGVYEPNPGPDLLRFLREKRQTIFNWRLTSTGRFHSVPINEGVAAMKLFAFGRRKTAAENKVQMLPIATIYDVFWKHAYTQLYCAVYDHARFLAVGTPSGTSLSRESGTHQSRQTPAMIMGLPNIIYYEPAYSFDVVTVYEWAIRQMIETDGEAVYMRLSTQDLVQPWGQPDDHLLKKHGLSRLPIFTEDESTLGRLQRDVINGGYWLVDYAGERDFEPSWNVAHIFASGSLMEEALKASEVLLERHHIFAKVCNVTSWERLKRDHDAYWSNPELMNDEGSSYHLHDLIPDEECGVPTVIVGDFAPEVAEWVSGALNRRIPVLAPKRFSVAGALHEIRKFHGIDAEAIVVAVLQEFSLNGNRAVS